MFSWVQPLSSPRTKEPSNALASPSGRCNQSTMSEHEAAVARKGGAVPELPVDVDVLRAAPQDLHRRFDQARRRIYVPDRPGVGRGHRLPARTGKRARGLGGEFAGVANHYVCPICFNERELDKAELVQNAELQGATPLMEFAGGQAMTFTY